MSRVAIAVLVLACGRTAAAGPIVGAGLDMIPGGSMEVQTATAGTMGFALAPSAGVSAQLGFRASLISVALVPRYLPSRHAELDPSSTFSQLDLAVRVAGHYAITPELDVFGFVAPGYSVLFTNNDGAAGAVLAIGIGAAYAVARHVELDATLAYDYGDQHSNDGALTAPRQLAFSLGVATR